MKPSSTNTMKYSTQEELFAALVKRSKPGAEFLSSFLSVLNTCVLKPLSAGINFLF
jgi:hypothetical protein